ncbi:MULTISPECIES: outer membrane lipoprotein carrier protein LolA [unclassified Motilimonas]|uniref:outer membrane lipoprotein carrier protein LolA n=1 Tax=Motilimonas TaxID=1914248 RepID=UPI001E5F49F3|nr:MULTISPECIES: outer membrane lipoprotein carrier protein LolA [unclassified Motilimonas]MCE0556468.1 outer membrane lipoprotein carrier protein LolA [Motilimonas sp. E26]MDO6527097.1 outer membrane lipoprotein carrier protein LolA [Motilimonas sp. 1_MG-2023]
MFKTFSSSLLLWVLTSLSLPAQANQQVLPEDKLFSPKFALTEPSAQQQQMSQVLTQLSQYSQLQGRFVQHRHLALLSQPLVSSGNFSLSASAGLHWQQITPFASQLSLNNTQLSQQIADGPVQVISAQEQPALFAFSSLFLGLFRGDEISLKQNFQLYFTGDINAWQLGGVPLGSPLNQAIKSIRLQGNKHINYFELIDSNQDKLTIEFSDVVSSNTVEP